MTVQIIKFLFGWFTKPMIEHTPLDAFLIIVVVEIVIVLFTIWTHRR